MTAVLEPEKTLAGPCCISCGCDLWSIEQTDLVDYLTGDTFSIHRCNRCNLFVTQPLPMGAEIGKYYPAQYRGNRHSFTGKMRCTLRRRAVESCFGKNFRGKLLDIGCGDGSFAMEMKSHGWDVSATEIDHDTIARLKSDGINAKLSHDAQANGFDDRFDAITCWHVLEHVEDPRYIAQWVASLLADNGVFQPTVPNVDCLQAKLFGRKWVHLDVPRHRQHFTPATLRSLLQSAGFQIATQSNFALEYDWFGVIQSALNKLCARQNVLFDKLTHAPIDASKPLPIMDVLVSAILTPFIASASLPLITAAALAGDGATLTFTCRAK